VKKVIKGALLVVALAAAALGGYLLWSGAGEETQKTENAGFHGVRGAFEGFSFEEYSADGKSGYVVKAKESYIRDQKFLKVLRFAGKRENILQTAEVTMLRDGAPTASATSPKGVYYTATGNVRLEEGVTIKTGDLTITSPVAFFKKDGTIELPGEFRVTLKDGSASTGKAFRGTPGELVKAFPKSL
jgi:hypothetical protein